MTVALITISPLAIVASYGAPPNKLVIPGVGDVYSAVVGHTVGNFQLVDVVVTPAQPPFTTFQSEVLSLLGNTLTRTTTYVARVLSKPELIAYAASVRTTKSTAGTALGATAIPTDIQTQVLLLGYYAKAIETPAFTVQWMKPDGTAVTLNATNIRAAAAQVGSFLGAILTKETVAVAGINANTITTPAQVDAALA